uniref:RING-type domain-containing protein n=1 Tax=Denticeps clupeoides TaxID=299321 RepID=A0AAY4BLV7_9TELE
MSARQICGSEDEGAALPLHFDAEAQECPVCYEGLADTARTLSCSHTFCHDCLVRTLVSISRDAVITRDSIVCPVCRHLTFITKRTDLARDEKSRRILEVPLSGPPQGPSGPATSPSPLAGGLSRLSHYVRWVSSRLSRQRLVRPSNPPSQTSLLLRLLSGHSELWQQ